MGDRTDARALRAVRGASKAPAQREIASGNVVGVTGVERHMKSFLCLLVGAVLGAAGVIAAQRLQPLRLGRLAEAAPTSSKTDTRAPVSQEATSGPATAAVLERE